MALPRPRAAQASQLALLVDVLLLPTRKRAAEDKCRHQGARAAGAGRHRALAQGREVRHGHRRAAALVCEHTVLVLAARGHRRDGARPTARAHVLHVPVPAILASPHKEMDETGEMKGRREGMEEQLTSLTPHPLITSSSPALSSAVSTETIITTGALLPLPLRAGWRTGVLGPGAGERSSTILILRACDPLDARP
ncbi:hypothetical protein MSAN_02305900 [Mycena sanguinolenta]|uniref:Uncharacterized protein n=1 Tax=Mycena sanguinolenta TaxID=230812 RepID=A0A8H6X7L9_9AGAR|nr:hypothetical protein MSAN_02305900 [Mycena sanguinolenta]